MKFAAFVLATAAATASAQLVYGPYTVPQPVNYPLGQPVYGVNQPLLINPDPLAWDRDCSFISAQAFRQILSFATCGTNSCYGPNTNQPNGNGGGYKRELKADATGGFPVWGTVINRAGRVCSVAHTAQRLDQVFPFGRIQSMKRANTAGALSWKGRAAPSLVLNQHENIDQPKNYYLTQTGAAAGQTVSTGTDFGPADNAWYGFTHDRFNPGNVDVQHQGAASYYGEACGGQIQDPMCMQKPGGYDYSAGGLALYNQNGNVVGAIGVAGDNDCASHLIAWKARMLLGLDYTPSNTQRATFNENTVCTTSTNANLLCGPAAPTWAKPAGAATTYTASSQAEFQHVGKFAEDNVYFSLDQRTNFGACYDKVRRLQYTNPTKQCQSCPAK